MSNTAHYRVGVRLEGSARDLARAAQEGRRAMRELGVKSVSEFNRMASARKTLGVRSEHEVRREIQLTQAAYNRLAHSGTQSWREQHRAAQAMRAEVMRLNNELGKYTVRQRLVGGLKGAAAVGAGVGVIGAVAAPKVQQALDYDTRLAHMANTAYAERNSAGRATGMRDLASMIQDAVRYGGGTRDSAAATAEQLLGAGVFKPAEIKNILRDAVMAGTASNADPAAFAQMAITANQTLGIKPEEMKRMFGIGTYAGQQGGFEIKDMAKWLPQQMAAAKAVGMYGEAGFSKLTALNQGAIVTAGTRDEAGNNVVNLLAKMGSQDTNKDFQRQGINLPQQLAQGRVAGLDALDVVGNLLQSQLAKDKNYQQVQRQLADAKDDNARRQALESVGNIAQGTVIGKVFQDRQALMALYGFVQNRDRVDAIARQAPGNADASQRNFDLLASTPGYKVQQAKNEAESALQTSMNLLTPTIGTLAEKTGALVGQYPIYSTAIAAATLALGGLATSAGALALLGGKIPGMAGVGAAGAGAALATGAKFAGGIGLAGAGGYAAGSLLYSGIDDTSFANGLGRVMHKTSAFFGGKESQQALQAEYNADRALASQPPARPPKSLADRFGDGTQAPVMFSQQELKGQIEVRVTAAPGLGVQTETSTNTPRIPMRASVGQGMQGSGF